MRLRRGWALPLLSGKGTAEHCAAGKHRHPSGSAPGQAHCQKSLLGAKLSSKYVSVILSVTRLSGIKCSVVLTISKH